MAVVMMEGSIFLRAAPEIQRFQCLRLRLLLYWFCLGISVAYDAAAFLRKWPVFVCCLHCSSSCYGCRRSLLVLMIVLFVV